MLSDPVHTEFNNGYCWFELMQIYDKISDCIYLFNNIYAGQILLMLNTWLVTSLVVICRFVSPMYKNTDAISPDSYLYFFVNIRILLLIGISERLMEERKRTLLLLEHVLIYHDLDADYRSQVEIMLELVQTRKTQLSAAVCPLNLAILITYSSELISYTILMIQKFYINFFLKN